MTKKTNLFFCYSPGYGSPPEEKQMASGQRGKAEGPSAKGGLPKHQFSTGFTRVCDSAGCHVSFIYKPNAFLIILEPLLRFGLKNYQISSGFIRYFD